LYYLILYTAHLLGALIDDAHGWWCGVRGTLSFTGGAYAGRKTNADFPHLCSGFDVQLRAILYHLLLSARCRM
jgi:hypothetical protein